MKRGRGRGGEGTRAMNSASMAPPLAYESLDKSLSVKLEIG